MPSNTPAQIYRVDLCHECIISALKLCTGGGDGGREGTMNFKKGEEEIKINTQCGREDKRLNIPGKKKNLGMPFMQGPPEYLL